MNEISEEQAAAVVREFLTDHPEHIQGVRQTTPGEMAEPTTVMDTDTLIAFTEWTIRTGRGDAAKAKRFREHIRQHLGR